MTTLAAPVVTPALRHQPRVAPRTLWLLVAALVMAGPVWQVAHGGIWSTTFYFDEMWRVDDIRADSIRDEMLVHGTPVPYGWLVLMRLLTVGLPYSPEYWREIAAAAMVLGLLLLGLLVMRLGRPEQRLHPMVGAFGAAALLFLEPVRTYLSSFNSYGFEVLYAAALLLASLELPRSRRALPAFCLLVAAAPMLVIGPLFLVPALVIRALLWAWRTPDAVARRRHLVVLAVGLVAAVADLAVVQLVFYGPMNTTSASLKGYWVSVGGSLGGSRSLLDLLGSLVHQLRDALVGSRALDAGGVVLLLATVLVVAAAVVGAVTVARRWPWLLIAPLSAQVLTIPASALTAWPINVQRVNLCFQVVLLAVVTLGAAQAVVLCVQRLRAPALVALPVLGLLLIGLWFRPVPIDQRVFGRGLYHDLDVVAQSPAARNLVFQYHYMGRYSAHDRLVNTRTPGRRFDLVYDKQGDRTLYTSLDGIVAAARLSPGDRVWCVMPYEIGPAAGRQACQVSAPGLERQPDVVASRSLLRSYVVR